MPLPPLAEHEQVVAEVEQRLSVVSALEAEVEANLTRADRLRQSILRRAFAGRLAPQNSDDEPARALLERIRGEREAQATAGKNGHLRGRAAKVGRERDAVTVTATGSGPGTLWETGDR